MDNLHMFFHYRMSNRDYIENYENLKTDEILTSFDTFFAIRVTGSWACFLNSQFNALHFELLTL